MGWVLFCDLTGTDLTMDNETYEVTIEKVSHDGERKLARRKMILSGIGLSFIEEGIDYARLKWTEGNKKRRGKSEGTVGNVRRQSSVEQVQEAHLSTGEGDNRPA